MRGRIWLHAFVLSLVATGALIGLTSDSITVPVAAQVPGPVQDAINSTQGQDQYALVHIRAHATDTFIELEEKSTAAFPISIEDHSAPGQSNVAPSVSVRCDAVASNNTPLQRGWAFSTQFIPPLAREQTTTTFVNVVAGPFAAPEYVHINVVCEAFSPFVREIGNFTLVARVLPYTYMQLTNVGVLPTLGPDEEFIHQVELTNLGNQVTTFVGRIRAPPGWEVTLPDSVTLDPGESRIINITGVTPRDQLVYLSKAEILNVEFFPHGEEGRSRTLPFVAQINGVYIHPAILPVVVLAFVILASIIFLAVLARRAIEEQILGKPVPPWRIPVEREYLQQLQRDDPDQFYIVRYYLMVEEHESALLWFAAYKRATKKDRKRERKWVKVKNKQDRKIATVEKLHSKVTKKWDRKMARVDKKRDRRIRKLERKLRRKERKAQRGVGKRHKKRVKKIEKRHAKRVKKIEKKHHKVVAKESKKVEKENRKRAKQGEELLPLPEIAPPELPELELPEMEDVKETPLEESRYAGRAEKRFEQAERKKERLRLRRDKTVSRDRLKADAKIEKLEAKLPPEPDTHLYDVDEYLSQDEVVVEDDRPLAYRLLNIPTLEERERIRRRKAVYQARLKEAKAANDPETVEAVKRQQREELQAIKQERQESMRIARAGDIEASRVKKERRRRAKESAKEKASAAPEEGPTVNEPPEEGVSPEQKIKSGLPVRLRGKKEVAPSKPHAEHAEATAEKGDTARGGFKARFQRKKAEASAGSEEDKKGPEESAEETAAREQS